MDLVFQRMYRNSWSLVQVQSDAWAAAHRFRGGCRRCGHSRVHGTTASVLSLRQRQRQRERERERERKRETDRQTDRQTDRDSDSDLSSSDLTSVLCGVCAAGGSGGRLDLMALAFLKGRSLISTRSSGVLEVLCSVYRSFLFWIFGSSLNFHRSNTDRNIELQPKQTII